MRRYIVVALLMLAVGAVVTVNAEPSEQPAAVLMPPVEPSYAEQRGCKQTYPSRKSYRKIKKMLRHHYPLRNIQQKRARHYAKCVATEKKAKAVRDYIRRSYKWRMKYEHRWPIVFHRYPAWIQNWAWSTGACESGNNPRTNTGNGFHGAFQFVMSTWYAAGGRGIPEAHSWWYQAVISIRLMLREGSGHWPVCG